jgi:hypothetical protein
MRDLAKRLGWPFLCLLLLIWALLVTAQLVTYHLRIVDVGSAAEWATAAVTALALGAAVWAGKAAHGQLKLMSDDAASRVERQARQVFVNHLRTSTSQGAPVSHHVIIDNRSNEPIRDVELLFLGPTNRNSFRYNLILPHEPFESPQAGAVVSAAIETLINGEERIRPVVEMIEFEFPLIFTDARNVQWIRHADHTLVQLPAGYKSGDARFDDQLIGRSRFKQEAWSGS